MEDRPGGSGNRQSPGKAYDEAIRGVSMEAFDWLRWKLSMEAFDGFRWSQSEMLAVHNRLKQSHYVLEMPN